jgi:hypothetical protein
MKYTPTEFEVLRSYLLIDTDGQLTRVVLERPETAPMGVGPLVEQAAIDKMIAADTTPNQRWLKWIFFQAGGGARAKEATVRAMDQIKERFIDERVNGFTSIDTKQYHAPVPKEDAEKRWVPVEAQWKAMLASADQDIVDHLGVFGFYRHWPGKDKTYERTAAAVRKFIKQHDKIVQMNAELVAQSTETLSEKPDDYKSLDDLEKIIVKVARYFASKVARDNVQVDPIFENDLVKVVCPKTYAASVRYGFDNWSFSNRATFEEVLSTDQSFRDAWKQTTQKNVLVFVYWKVPMPSWVSRKNNQFQRYELTNLAIEIPRTDFKHTALASAPVHDEENAANLNLEQVADLIHKEAAREADPQDEEMPIKRGPNAYATESETKARISALNELTLAINKWRLTFDLESIQSDVYADITAEA